MFYFTERVVELKAWQLYLGNAFWSLFVGLLLLVIAKVLGLIGFNSTLVDDILSKTGHITHARNPEVLSNLASQIYEAPGHILDQNGQHPTQHPTQHPSQVYYS